MQSLAAIQLRVCLGRTHVNTGHGRYTAIWWVWRCLALPAGRRSVRLRSLFRGQWGRGLPAAREHGQPYSAAAERQDRAILDQLSACRHSPYLSTLWLVWADRQRRACSTHLPLSDGTAVWVGRDLKRVFFTLRASPTWKRVTGLTSAGSHVEHLQSLTQPLRTSSLTGAQW
jgi:hypothetical protein